MVDFEAVNDALAEWLKFRVLASTLFLCLSSWECLDVQYNYRYVSKVLRQLLKAPHVMQALVFDAYFVGK